ncbi:MAG: cytochrome c oxidase assembly protein [Nitrososphaerales archaeon]
MIKLEPKFNFLLSLISFFLSFYIFQWMLFDPYIDYLEETNLFFHMMGQHTLLLLAGYLIPFGFEKLALSSSRIFKGSNLSKDLLKLYRNLVLLNYKLNPKGFLTLSFTIIIVSYWHIPIIFDLLQEEEFTHQFMHFTYSLAGSLIYMSYKRMPFIISVILASAVHKVMLIGSFLILLSPNPIYKSYSLQENIANGYYMAIMGAIGEVIFMPLIVYFIYKWLKGERVLIRIPLEKDLSEDLTK